MPSLKPRRFPVPTTVFAGDYYLQHNGNYGAGLNKDDWVDMEFAGLMLPYDELALTYG